MNVYIITQIPVKHFFMLYVFSALPTAVIPEKGAISLSAISLSDTQAHR